MSLAAGLDPTTFSTRVFIWAMTPKRGLAEAALPIELSKDKIYPICTPSEPGRKG